jgi:hypothetical protein
MTIRDENLSELELRARAVLQESLQHIDARTRSRLNRARQAALASVPAPGAQRWRGLRLMPVTGGVAAALLFGLLLLNLSPGLLRPKAEGAQPSVEVLDMLADEDGMRLAEDDDHSFYEWAADQGAQGDASAEQASAGASG